MGKLYKPGDILRPGTRRLISTRPQLLVTRRPASAIWTNETLIGDWLLMGAPHHAADFIRLANETRTQAPLHRLEAERRPINPGRLRWYYIAATGDDGVHDKRYFAAHCDIYNSRIERLSRSGEWQDITTEVAV